MILNRLSKDIEFQNNFELIAQTIPSPNNGWFWLVARMVKSWTIILQIINVLTCLLMYYGGKESIEWQWKITMLIFVSKKGLTQPYYNSIFSRKNDLKIGVVWALYLVLARCLTAFCGVEHSFKSSVLPDPQTSELKYKCD